MKKALLVLAILTGVILILSSCEKKVYVYEDDTTPPSSPKGVYSVTGDQTVYIYWAPNDEKDLNKYKIYRSLDPDDPFEYLASTHDSSYIDQGLTNGTTYYYIITAVDFSGNESGYSGLISDTPRPVGFSYSLFDKAINRRLAGIYFKAPQGLQIVPWDSSACDIYLDEVSGTFYLNTTNKNGVWNDIQDMGYTDNLDEITYAPNTGWSDLGYEEVITGHTYVIWTWDLHYAKLRITHEYSDYITFEWAYQTAVENQELKPVPKKPR
ncbi:MAG TPA: hypothetical protein VMT04_09910 [Terriglobales bacterium]|nr:hypothetical protein [Terriglobales bacterium]